ncbi:uncharacterized protein LOC131892295 [Tigriopus californicus]|uniref:uncharacterized protein LOC131892295 n=1 Tax=Tigriopus californicus TaxID=6832 RepID=UPI0027DA32AA|nr:uncharacterized protein LOC131892295 [Tigriopus californicus]
MNSSIPKWAQKFEYELLSGQAHLSIGYLTVHADLVSAMVLRSIVYANYDEYAVTRTPQPTQNILNLIEVFDMATWTTLAMFLLIFTVLSFIFARVYNGLDANQCRRVSFLEIFIVLFSGFTEPDPVAWFSKQCKGGLLLILMWSLFGFFMTASYSSMLLSSLTLPSFEKVVQEARDILDLQKTIIVDPHDDDGYSLERLKEIFPEDVALWANDHKVVLLFETLADIEDGVINFGKVYLASKRSILEQSIFNKYLTQIRFSTYPITYGRNDDTLYVGKGFPWTDLILDDMLRMFSGGVFHHYFYDGISVERLQLLKPRSIPESSYVNAVITLEQIMFIFWFWMAGLFLGGFIFCLERAQCPGWSCK